MQSALCVLQAVDKSDPRGYRPRRLLVYRANAFYINNNIRCYILSASFYLSRG